MDNSEAMIRLQQRSPECLAVQWTGENRKELHELIGESESHELLFQPIHNPEGRDRIDGFIFLTGGSLQFQLLQGDYLCRDIRSGRIFTLPKELVGTEWEKRTIPDYDPVQVSENKCVGWPGRQM